LEHAAATAIVRRTIRTLFQLTYFSHHSPIITTSSLFAKYLMQQQSCFRGFREFVKYVIDQYFIIKMQTLARSYLARCQFKQLKKEDREKMQNERETKAAMVIQHFFIKITAEIEIEIMRLKQTKVAKKKSREGGDRTGRQNKPSAGIENRSIDPSSFNVKGSYNVSSVSGGQSRRFFRNDEQDFHNVRNASPSMERMTSIQAANSTGNVHAYQMNNRTPKRVANLSIDTNHQNAMRGGQTKRYANDEQDFHNVRNASPSMERMTSIQAANSTGNVHAYQMNNGTPKRVAHLSIDTNHQNAMRGGQTRRYAHNVGHDMYTMRNLSSSREQLPLVHPTQSNGNECLKANQMSNVTPRIVADQNMGRNHQHALSQASPSKERIILTSQMNLGQFKTQNAGQDRHHAGWGTPSMDEATSRHQNSSFQSTSGSSLPNKRVPSFQSIVQQGVYGPYASFNQAMHAPSPSYGNTHPFHHHPLNHNSSLQHPPNFQALRGAHNPQSEPIQWHNPPIQPSHHLTTNLMSRSNSHPEHQRHPAQSQPPAQSDQYNMRQYHQNARY
jgi:hypothetical protein